MSNKTTATKLAAVKARSRQKNEDDEKAARQAAYDDAAAQHEHIADMARERVTIVCDEEEVDEETREHPYFKMMVEAIINGWTTQNPFHYKGRLPAAIDLGDAATMQKVAHDKGVPADELLLTEEEIEALEDGIDVAARSLKMAMTDDKAAKKAAEADEA